MSRRPGHYSKSFEVKLEVELNEDTPAHELEETVEWLVEMNGGIVSVTAIALEPGTLVPERRLDDG